MIIYLFGTLPKKFEKDNRRRENIVSNLTIKARSQQKTGLTSEWAKATGFTPLKGEIIVYSDLNKIKIGDGETNVNDLDFIGGANAYFIYFEEFEDENGKQYRLAENYPFPSEEEVRKLLQEKREIKGILLPMLGDDAPVFTLTYYTIEEEVQFWLHFAHIGTREIKIFEVNVSDEELVWTGFYPHVKIDSTLSLSGQAADAKVVGDALATKADKSVVDTLEGLVGETSVSEQIETAIAQKSQVQIITWEEND